MSKSSLIAKIKKFDSRITSARRENRVVSGTEERGYREVSGVGKANLDWPFNMLGEDSDLWQNAWALTSRCRDLFRTNPLYIKYRELLWANIFGNEGIMLRMKIKETEDRVVYSPDEAKALLDHEKRRNRILQWAERHSGYKAEQYRAFHLAEKLSRASTDDIIRGQAMVKVGMPDVFANMRVEGGYKQWQRAQFCDGRKTRTYNTLRQLRLISAVRDGDFFIRKMKGPKVNKFGFSLQLINSEWVDRFFNSILPNGNVVIMGIEYKMTIWGVGEPVAYYMIKRQPQDWQFTIPGAFNFASGTLHVRIEADEIIHYARPVDADSTRPAPWICSTIPQGRQLDQWQLAHVVAAREAACKVGYLYSDLNPDGGMATQVDPKTGLKSVKGSAGDIWALPWGVKFSDRNSQFPSANASAFRKDSVRAICAGMPGADYNTVANDLENINFSAGRLGRLDTNEMSKLIQTWDIECAERPIFEDWLEMSMIMGVLEFDYSAQKFEKFNKPVFQGRRWSGVDEVKEATAAALRIQNNESNWTEESAENGKDFEELMFQKAEDLMLMEELGIDTMLTATPAHVAAAQAGDEDDKPNPPKPESDDDEHDPTIKSRVE